MYPHLQYGLKESTVLTFEEYSNVNKFCSEEDYLDIKDHNIGKMSYTYNEALEKHNEWLISSYDMKPDEEIFTAVVGDIDSHRKFLLESIGNYKIPTGDGFNFIKEYDIEALLSYGEI